MELNGPDGIGWSRWNCVVLGVCVSLASGLIKVTCHSTSLLGLCRIHTCTSEPIFKALRCFTPKVAIQSFPLLTATSEAKSYRLRIHTDTSAETDHPAVVKSTVIAVPDFLHLSILHVALTVYALAVLVRGSYSLPLSSTVFIDNIYYVSYCLQLPTYGCTWVKTPP